MNQKEFDQCLHNLIVTATTGGHLTNSQLIGSLELAKMNLHSMMMLQAQAAAQKNIVRVSPPIPPGLTPG